jgi:hypothetical protein
VILIVVPEGRKLPISLPATVYTACRLVQSEFGVERPLRASIYDDVLHFDTPLFQLVQEDDVVLFSDRDVARLPEIPPNHFRVFSSISVASLTEGDLLQVPETADPGTLRTLISRLLQGKPGVPSNAQFHVYLPGGSIFESGTIAAFRSSFPKMRGHLYAVVTKPIDPSILRAPVDQLVDTKMPIEGNCCHRSSHRRISDYQ